MASPSTWRIRSASVRAWHSNVCKRAGASNTREKMVAMSSRGGLVVHQLGDQDSSEKPICLTNGPQRKNASRWLLSISRGVEPRLINAKLPSELITLFSGRAALMAAFALSVTLPGVLAGA